jgi:hypothetical protein
MDESLQRRDASRTTSWAARLLAAFFILAGIVYGWTALVSLAGSAWPQPAFDQYRQYPTYLELPFPENVLQRENGHRPIVPGLVRVAEVHWLDADQSLQIWLGVVCAALTAALVGLIAMRDRAMSLPARGAALAASIMAVLWLGNARMLMHGNELLCVYIPSLCLVLGTLAVWQAGRGNAVRWMIAASAAATVAAFCFGLGMALFPALVIAAWLVGVRWRAIAVPVVACIVCVLLYVVVLPGNEEVRGSLELRPVDTLQMAARMASSPWINAWLGFADPPLNGHHAQLIDHGWRAFWGWSADLVQAASGLSWSVGLATLIGAAGFAAGGAWLLQAARRRRPLAPLQLIALVLVLFGAASVLVIAVGRLSYLEQNPGQVFADRYVVWPCMFWLGIVLLMLSGEGRVGRPLRAIALLAMIAMPFALWPTHDLGAGWSAAVYRGNQTSAAAARADVIDLQVFGPVDDASAPMADKIRSIELFRERGLAMFATPGATMLGETWKGALEDASASPTSLTPLAPVEDVRRAGTAMRFSGVLPHEVAMDDDDLLAVLDSSDRIAGFAQPSHAVDGAALAWWPARKRGFDGYIHDFASTQSYRLVRLDVAAGQGALLATIPPP